MTASMRPPDVVITVDEAAFFVRQVSRSSMLPVQVDGDTSYGKALDDSIVRTVVPEVAPEAGSCVQTPPY